MKALLAFVSTAPAIRRLGKAALALALIALSSSVAQSQFGPPPPGTDVHDASALKPPAGARVAIVEFLDLQCPDCAHANPVVNDAVAKYRIPLVRYDFPLPFHSWSLDAAINARWFDIKSKALGSQFRDELFAAQPTIKSRDDLTAFAQKFATAHNLQFPATVDPTGELARLVKADYALGQKIGVEHTPTIWIVTAGSKGSPFVEVVDRGQLYQMIEQALKDTGAKKP